MTSVPVPDEVRRFILTSIPSVPHLEAMLLTRSDVDHAWSAGDVAKRLYISEKDAANLLMDLHAIGVLAKREPPSGHYCFRPVSDELSALIAALAHAYSSSLVEITHLIHSKAGRRAQHFADAFKWRKDR